MVVVLVLKSVYAKYLRNAKLGLVTNWNDPPTNGQTRAQKMISTYSGFDNILNKLE